MTRYNCYAPCICSTTGSTIEALGFGARMMRTPFGQHGLRQGGIARGHRYGLAVHRQPTRHRPQLEDEEPWAALVRSMAQCTAHETVQQAAGQVGMRRMMRGAGPGSQGIGVRVALRTSGIVPLGMAAFARRNSTSK
jgi:hypothetical protein